MLTMVGMGSYLAIISNHCNINSIIKNNYRYNPIIIIVCEIFKSEFLRFLYWF